jgi:hypothetical protein
MEVTMRANTYCLVSATIFFLLGAAHIVRLFTGFALELGPLVVPRWASVIGALVGLGLATWGFRSARRMRMASVAP